MDIRAKSQTYSILYAGAEYTAFSMASPPAFIVTREERVTLPSGRVVTDEAKVLELDRYVAPGDVRRVLEQEMPAVAGEEAE